MRDALQGKKKVLRTLGNLAKLDPFRSLLLTKEDNPLVELAELAGYAVYLLAEALLLLAPPG